MKQFYFIILLFFATALGAVAQTTNIATLTQNAKAGDAKAQKELADAYYDGKGVTKNFTEAVKWYTKAAEQGYAKAQCNLGNCYYYGKGVAKDFTEAAKWYRKAAEQGIAVAQTNLGQSYHAGEGVAKDFTEAVKWYTKAAEQGYDIGQTLLGDCYYNGEGVSKDFTEAVKWYKKAAEQGNAEAQYSLAWCYGHEQGVAKDLTEAFKWYTKAANQGNADAQYCLAGCYGEGKGVTQSGVQSMNWYIKAAKNGHSKAACVYGSNLLVGAPQFHVQKNVAEAVKYLRIAADNNDKDAIDLLVGSYMSDMQGEKKYGIEKHLSYENFAKYLKMGAELGDTDMQTLLSALPKLKLMFAQEKELVAKYGQKAYNSIRKGNVYVGMPEGILTAYRTIEDDGSRYQMYKYNGSYRDKVGTYKQYIPNSFIQLVNSLGQVYPKIVKVRNGKVTNVVY